MERKITYLKTGMGIGGATLSDLDLLRQLATQGCQITIITGWLDPLVKNELDDGLGIGFVIDRKLDRRNSPRLYDISADNEVVTKKIEESDVVVCGQPFCSRHKYYSQLILHLSSYKPVFLRSHDLPDDMEAVRSLQGSTVLASTEALARRYKEINPALDCFVVPPAVRVNWLRGQYSYPETLDRLGVHQDDIVVFQPTRVDEAKQIDLAILLSSLLKKRFPYQQIWLVVAGGAEPIYSSRQEKKNLENYAASLGFEGLLFLGGISQREKRNLYHSASLVTFMSRVEGWGIPPAEAAAVGVPCVTTRYTNSEGAEVFREVYESKGFEFTVIGEPSAPIGGETLTKAYQQIRAPDDFNDAKKKNQVLSYQYSARILGAQFENYLAMDDERDRKTSGLG